MEIGEDRSPQEGGVLTDTAHGGTAVAAEPPSTAATATTTATSTVPTKGTP
jgi:hypothetical protein